MGHYDQCRMCGNSFGHGKGFDRLARHECDHAVRYARKFFLAGADCELIGRAMEWTQDQVEYMLRRSTSLGG